MSNRVITVRQPEFFDINIVEDSEVEKIAQYSESVQKQAIEQADQLFPVQFDWKTLKLTGPVEGRQSKIEELVKEAGLSFGDGFIETPFGRLDWKHKEPEHGYDNGPFAYAVVEITITTKEN